MTKTPTREDIKAIIDKRILSGEEFTYSQLSNIKEVDEFPKGWRIADLQIQKHRRNGTIFLTRKGRDCIWALVPKKEQD